MTQQLAARPLSTQSVSTPEDGRRLAAILTDAMSALLQLVDRETDLVRRGKIREAMTTAAGKGDMSRAYVAAITQFKASQPYLAKALPDLLRIVQLQHEQFRAMLQVNLTVLATAHAVSEGIVRAVNTEIQRRNAPNTYTAYGQRAAPAARHAVPIAVNRSL